MNRREFSKLLGLTAFGLLSALKYQSSQKCFYKRNPDGSEHVLNADFHVPREGYTTVWQPLDKWRTEHPTLTVTTERLTTGRKETCQ